MNRLEEHAPLRVSICTLGCKVNQYESAQLLTLLAKGGYTVAMGDHQGADLYIINTCTVTGSTDAQSRQLVSRIIRLNPGAPVLVTGCYAQVAPDVFRAVKGVCGVVGKADEGHILKHVDQIFGRNTAPADEAHAELPTPSFPHRTRAFVKVQDGCDRGCSYCIIPRARGPSRSRSPDAIVREVRTLSYRGHREIVITGVNLGLYGLDINPPQSLPVLMLRISEHDHVSRLRLSSLDPLELIPSLMDWMASCPAACPHFHISLQSGDNEVLQQMNRRYTAEDFHSKVEESIRRIPDMAVGVDVMAGFPGEDEAAFKRTYRLLEDLPVAYLHVFPFSPRPGTPAARSRHQVGRSEIRRRCAVLRQLGAKKRENLARGFMGRRLKVLVESSRDPSTGMLRGFTPNYIPVKFPGTDEWMNREIGVRINEVHGAKIIGLPDGKYPGEE